MNVLDEILEWSQDRPAWQRDTLRRLVLNGDLSDDDLSEQTEICKSAHGLAEQQDFAPLTSNHTPASRTLGTEPVSLDSIYHHRGVNALAENQTLKFGPNLTVVYGDNAAGKSGYIRILKSACRARQREEVLGNVVSEVTPHAPEVSIKFRVGTMPEPQEWYWNSEDEFISRVSVFDTHCASVYLTEKTDVAFRPFGLDLFDKLVKACKGVRARLENEQSALETNTLTTVEVSIPDGTGVAKLLENLSSLTKPEAVEELARLSPEETTRLTQLEKSLLDLRAKDPKKLFRELTLRTERVRKLVQHIKKVEAALSVQTVDSNFAVRAEVRRKSEKARKLREATFAADILTGTGSEQWTALWEAARQFSQERAYPNQEFPPVAEGAHCVLCQQDLDHAARHRLRQFEAFVVSTTERDLREIQETFVEQKKDLSDLKTTSEAISETLKEIRIEHEEVADTITRALATNEERRKAVVQALNEEKDLASDCPAPASVAHEAESLVHHFEARIETLRTTADDKARRHLNAETQELRARKLLAEHEQTVLDEIERQKKYAAYGLCIDETNTQTITQKSTAVTKAAVSQKLVQRFQDELADLAFRDVEVELQEVGGEKGVFYHKLILTHAPDVELPKVVSEGEQRCLAIAAFFAELSTAEDSSAIVFDDPVSSLDYKWRKGVARRLVKEAKERQVIVFTHDVVFLLLLKQLAGQLDVPQLDQHVRNLSEGAGVCAEELPWVALPVKKKIGYLKNEWQAADKLFRDGDQKMYEKDAKYLYSLLREAWERALEEVLLAGIVERFRPSIQTQHIGTIADITPEDCRALHAAMTKCSQWLHDQAAAARAPIPEPAELKTDIETLESWVKEIHKRRK